MKIIAIANTYPAYNKTAFPAFDKAEGPVVFSHADSALLKDGKPFFIPEFAEPCTYQVELVVRICRLGKSIPERFASRYYDGVTVGIAFTAHGLLERFCRAGYPWDLATGFDGAAAVGNFVPTGVAICSGASTASLPMSASSTPSGRAISSLPERP